MFSPDLLKGKVVYFKKSEIMCLYGITSLCSFNTKSVASCSF